MSQNRADSARLQYPRYLVKFFKDNTKKTSSDLEGPISQGFQFRFPGGEGGKACDVDATI